LIIPVEEFVTATVNVPPMVMSGGEVVPSLIKEKLKKTKWGVVIAEHETPSAKTSVTERFLNGNFIVAWEKE
jgi:hypothetical protein